MLRQRIITAFVLLLVSLFALFMAPPLLWQGLVVLVVAIAAWEWTQFARLEKVGYRLSFVALSVLLLSFGLFYGVSSFLVLMALIQLVLVVYGVTRFQITAGKPLFSQPLVNLAVGLLFMISFGMALVWLRDIHSVWLLLLSLAMIWLVDTGAYFSGRRFGKHKLAPYVSPGKTWEGVIGGVLLAMSVALITWFVFDINYQPGLVVYVLGLSLIAGLSVYGDLFESLMKRQVGLKDSGKILPGHGGVLDRIDSLLLALPLYWIFWAFA
ncbi:CDP-archaeol synthase [Thiomicrospira microaerophila]|uniref:phosphatidate cytidylyltransferase n=1 Tax=Thiomicrospira microaerophila TaxID=406020 RepID=UPI00200DE663|nr:phosphatidate cytidylyltransferase [Thiomicrospira microaerophila]UQB41378.1 CDP-archaeol synthase [Thiomicrospira microaerophila]